MLYPRISLYALMLACAGIPLYIHLPQFAATNLGINLGTLGVVLLAIRAFDLVQDPLIGWAIDQWPQMQSGFSLAAAGGLALGFPLLFGLRDGPHVLVKLILILVLLFSAYSLGMILLYGRSATLAKTPETRALMTLASYRECGMLAGVVLAAIAPTVLIGFGASEQGYGSFGLLLGLVAVVTALLTRPIWTRPVVLGQPLSLASLSQAGAVQLLILAVLNSLPGGSYVNSVSLFCPRLLGSSEFGRAIVGFILFISGLERTFLDRFKQPNRSKKHITDRHAISHCQLYRRCVSCAR